MGRRILRHTYRSQALAFVVNVARGERSEEDVPAMHVDMPDMTCRLRKWKKHVEGVRLLSTFYIFLQCFRWP